MGLLAQELAGVTRQKPGPPCGIAVALASDILDDEDRAALLAAFLPDSKTPMVEIARKLRKAKFEIGNDAPSRHRRGECACGPAR